jgi:hypothetical protein
VQAQAALAVHHGMIVLMMIAEAVVRRSFAEAETRIPGREGVRKWMKRHQTKADLEEE